MDNKTAFPQYIISNGGAYVDGGMTLRDYFAAKALPLAMEDFRQTIDRVDECLDLEWEVNAGLSSVAERAYEMADAMLKERMK